jgi:FAD/FMN-containing dehydrogenase
MNASLAAAAGALIPVRHLWAGTGGDAVPGEIAARSGADRSISLGASDIKDLRASLRGELLLAGNVGYDSARQLWNGAFDRHPALIARCGGTADVIRAVQFARAHDLLTAVRGGGHSLSGQSGCDGGLVIDLSPMRGIRVDPVRLRAEAQPGVLLGELDWETQAFGLATTLGTAPDTGIAGLTLGGGMGRLARKFGLACDNLRSADVVTAQGKLLHASEQENADLFWGLRGGGGNFGIVTKFEYQLHPLGPQVLAGDRTFPFSQARSVLTAVAELADRAPDEMYFQGYTVRTSGLPTPGLAVGVEVCYCGDDLREGQRLLEPLKKLGKPLSDDLGAKTYLTAQGVGVEDPDPNDAPGRGHYLKSGFSTGVSASLIDEMVRRAADAPAAVAYVWFLQVGGAAGRVKPEATAYWNRQANYDVALEAAWANHSESAQNVKVARELWKGLEPFTRGYYINTEPDAEADRLRATYGENYPRLVRLKNQYDPTNFFRLNANIRPAST